MDWRHGEQTHGPLARNSLSVDSQDPRPGTENGLGHLATPAPDVEPDSAGQPRIALSGASQAGARGLDIRRMEGVAHRTSGQVLFAYPSRPSPTAPGGGELDTLVRGDHRYCGVGLVETEKNHALGPKGVVEMAGRATAAARRA